MASSYARKLVAYGSPWLAATLWANEPELASEYCTATVALVNGEPIARGELQRAFAQEKAAVYDYFWQKYRVRDGANFWRENHGGETSIEVLREHALGSLVKIKVQQVLMRVAGV